MYVIYCNCISLNSKPLTRSSQDLMKNYEHWSLVGYIIQITSIELDFNGGQVGLGIDNRRLWEVKMQRNKKRLRQDGNF
jgi:hypothetical protein